MGHPLALGTIKSVSRSLLDQISGWYSHDKHPQRSLFLFYTLKIVTSGYRGTNVYWTMPGRLRKGKKESLKHPNAASDTSGGSRGDAMTQLHPLQQHSSPVSHQLGSTKVSAPGAGLSGGRQVIVPCPFSWVFPICPEAPAAGGGYTGSWAGLGQGPVAIVGSPSTSITCSRPVGNNWGGPCRKPTLKGAPIHCHCCPHLRLAPHAAAHS